MSATLSTRLQTTTNAQDLMSAVEAGDAVAVASLLAGGARADAPLANGETPLMRAAARGYADVARVLLDRGGRVNARRADGFTPLILAAFFRHEAVVRLLLEHGADASAATRLGTTAKKWVLSRGFTEIAELLESVGAARGSKTAAISHGEKVLEESASGEALQGMTMSARVGEETEAETGGSEVIPVHVADKVDAALVGGGGFAVAADSRNDVGRAGSGQTIVVETSVAPATQVSLAAKRRSRPSFDTGLRGFFKSWQAAVGAAFLVIAFGIVFLAAWRRTDSMSEQGLPAPPVNDSAVHPAAPLPPPATAEAAEQPSSTFQKAESPDATATTQSVTSTTYVAPSTASQPVFIPPVGNPGPSNAPKELMVVSESDDASPQGRPASRRQPDATTRETVPAAPPAGARPEESREENARTEARDTDSRTAVVDPRPAAPAQPSSPVVTSPLPSPTPARRKVIQWP